MHTTFFNKGLQLALNSADQGTTADFSLEVRRILRRLMFLVASNISASKEVF